MSRVDTPIEHDEKTRRRAGNNNTAWRCWLRKTRRYVLPCVCAVNDVDAQEQHEVSEKEGSTTISRDAATAQTFGGITTTVTTTTTTSISPAALAAQKSWETTDDEDDTNERPTVNRRRRRWAVDNVPPVDLLDDIDTTPSHSHKSSLVQSMASHSHKSSLVQSMASHSHTSSLVQSMASHSHTSSLVQSTANHSHTSSLVQSMASYGSHPTYSTMIYGSNRGPPPPPLNVTPASNATPESSTPLTPSTASESPRGTSPLLPTDGHDNLNQWAQSTKAALSWLTSEEPDVPMRTRRRWGYVKQN